MAIGMAESNNQVTPEALDKREEPRRKKAEPNELEALRERIASASSLLPAPHEVHCLDCFKKGRDAAIAAIEATPKS